MQRVAVVCAIEASVHRMRDTISRSVRLAMPGSTGRPDPSSIAVDPETRMMIRSPSVLVVPLLLAMVPAQEPAKPKPAQKAIAIQPAPAPKEQTQEELVKLRDAKLAKEVFHQHAWITDLAKARALAKESGKPIFTYITRSYAY